MGPYVTKHCTPEVRKFMLGGGFKIGTHGEYSKGEGSGLLSDTAEGQGFTNVVGDLINFSGRIGNATFHNVNIIGGREASVRMEERIDCNIFCASAGPYDSGRHKQILEGSPDVVAYVVLDREKLLQALTAASEEIFGVGTYIWIERMVEYGDRLRKINAAVYWPGIVRSRGLEMAFIKPKHFNLEQEHRFMLLPFTKNMPPSPIFTSKLSNGTRTLFQDAIVDDGADAPN